MPGAAVLRWGTVIGRSFAAERGQSWPRDFASCVSMRCNKLKIAGGRRLRRRSLAASLKVEATHHPLSEEGFWLAVLVRAGATTMSAEAALTASVSAILNHDCRRAYRQRGSVYGLDSPRRGTGAHAGRSRTCD